MNIQNCRGRFIQPVKNTKKQTDRQQSHSLMASRPLLPESNGAVIPNSSNIIGEKGGFSSKMVDTEFRFGLSSKSDPTQISFDIGNSSIEIVQLGNKLSNLLSQFIDFYLYLQEWGIDFTSSNRVKSAWNFNFETVLRYEKELELEVEQFNTNLGNLYEFLCGEKPSTELTYGLSTQKVLRKVLSQKSSLTFDAKKELLVDQKILEILLLILQLIESKMIGTLRAAKPDKEDDKEEKGLKEKKLEPISYNALKNLNWDKFEQLPQLVAKAKLEKTLGLVLKVLLLAAWRNHICSFYLSLHISFFENLLEFYPNEIIELCSEIASNLGCEKQTYSDFIKPWPGMLEEVNERSGNIKKQICLLQLLSRLVVNNLVGEVYPLIQNKLFDLLYRNRQAAKGMKQLRFGLQQSNDPDDEGRNAEVIFITANSRSTGFTDNNPSVIDSQTKFSNASSVNLSLALLSRKKSLIDPQEHVNYIAAFLRLFTAICKNGNADAILIITGPQVGLSIKFCEYVLGARSISPIIKAAVAEFYSEVFVNSSPFESILQRPIECFSYDRVKQLVLTERAWPMIDGNKKLHTSDGESAEKRMHQLELRALMVIKDAFSVMPKTLIEGKKAPIGVTIIDVSTLDGQSLSMITQACIRNLETSNSDVIGLLHYQRAVINLLSKYIEFGIASLSLIKLSVEISGLALKLKISPSSDLASSAGLFFLAYARSKKFTKLAHSQLVDSALQNLRQVSRIRRLYGMCANIKLWHTMSEALAFDTSEDAEFDSERQKEYQVICQLIFSVFSLQSHPDFSTINSVTSLNRDISGVYKIIMDMESEIEKELEEVNKEDLRDADDEEIFPAPVVDFISHIRN